MSYWGRSCWGAMLGVILAVAAPVPETAAAGGQSQTEAESTTREMAEVRIQLRNRRGKVLGTSAKVVPWEAAHSYAIKGGGHEHAVHLQVSRHDEGKALTLHLRVTRDGAQILDPTDVDAVARKKTAVRAQDAVVAITVTPKVIEVRTEKKPHKIEIDGDSDDPLAGV